MAALINLVGTQCVDGNHQALQRWYTDHVHMLMGFPDLHGAVLYRVRAGSDATAPHYLCLYEFASAPAFQAYETGALRAEVEQDRQRGWGRDGIRIVMRAPYERLYRRDAGASVAAAAAHRVLALRSEGEPSAAIERALAAGVDAGTAMTLLRSAQRQAPVADYLVLAAPAAGAQGGVPEGLSLAWQCEAETLLRWRR